MEALLGADAIEGQAGRASRAFGRMIKERRRALLMTQDDLALATGVGRRFIVDLEAGKPTAQIGRSLLVAQRLGLTLSATARGPVQDTPDLPDVEDDDAATARSL